MASSKDMDRPGKIIVTGIPKGDTFTEADLEKEFSPFGRITEVFVVKNKRTNGSRGFGFITYENPQDAFDAMKAMSGKDLGGNKPLHCEQATLGVRMREQNAEEESRGRGGPMSGRGRGDSRGRGGFRGRGGGGSRGRGDMMSRGAFRDDRGRGGFRGGIRGGGRGRGEYHDQEYTNEFSDHGFEDVRGPPRPPLMGRGGRGGPVRKTLLPDPAIPGMRRGGPPQHRGPPGHYGQYEGRDEYYEEGGDYERGYEEGYGEEYADDYYGQEEYQEHFEERRPVRGGPGRGRVQPLMGSESRRGGMEQSRRGGMERARRGMEPPRRGAEPRRGEMEPPRSLMDPLPRGGMPPRGRGAEYAEEDEGVLHRGPQRHSRGAVEERGLPSREGWLPPRRHQEDYGYSEEGQDQHGAEHWDDGYREDSTAEVHGRGPRGRPMPTRGGLEPSSQRRRPLLGDDPFSATEAPRDYYGRRPAPPTEMGQEDYSKEDGYNGPNFRHRPNHPEERYREGGPDGAVMRGGRGSRRPLPGGRDRYEEESLYDKPGPGMGRRDGYGESRPDEGHLDHRGATEMHSGYHLSRDLDFGAHNRKRPMEEEGQGYSENLGALRRQYENLMDRVGSGPTGPKRDRYEGYY